MNYTPEQTRLKAELRLIAKEIESRQFGEGLMFLASIFTELEHLRDSGRTDFGDLFFAVRHMINTKMVRLDELEQIADFIPSIFNDCAAVRGVSPEVLTQQIRAGEAESIELLIGLANYWAKRRAEKSCRPG